MDSLSSRRTFLKAALATTGSALAGCQSPGSGDTPTRTEQTDTTPVDETTEVDGGKATTPAPELPETLAVEEIATGLTAPVDIAFPTDPTVSAYVADQAGRVFVLDSDGIDQDPFLDVTDRMVELDGYEERGLLGLALHPEFESNGRVFIRYSGRGGPAGYDHQFVLSEFEATDDRGAAKSGSERRHLEIPQPQANHNAGPILFGPDGYLYVAVGDGGGGGDRGQGHVSDWYDRNKGGNGQDVRQNLLGSILRIDVDSPGEDTPYTIPEENPLVGRSGLDEHYAWGFRNPWGMSMTGEELFVADVGQNRFEEVNIVEKGGNYGWNVKEATHCFSTETPSEPPDSCPDTTPDGASLRDPIIEYSHAGPIGGAAVVGGYLYTGERIPSLEGAYVFADWQARGRLYVATRAAGAGLWPITPIDVSGPPSFGGHVLGFGRDSEDELYVLTADRTTVSGSTGAVHRLVSEGD